MNILYFSFLFSLATCQQLINLNSFLGGNVKNQLNGEKEYGIFVSAKSDSTDFLSKIFVVQDGDGTQASLEELRQKKVFLDSGEIDPFVVSVSAYVITNLTDDQLNTLTGVMFLSTPAQCDDINFHVIDVTVAQTVDFSFLGDSNSTIMFLNTDMGMFVSQSSIISSWNQTSSVSTFLYPGIPLDTMEPPKTQIFSNPMHEAVETFFTNVETFSVVLPAFYFRTFNGSPLFKIEPGYYGVDRTNTSSFSTTGFYMKQLGELDDTVVINTMRDTEYSGSTGANIIGTLSNGGLVSIGEYDGAYHHEETITPNVTISSWNAPAIGKMLEISSSIGRNGQYFLQYYVAQGSLLPVTTTSGLQTSTASQQTSTPTTTTTVNSIPTTTTVTTTPTIRPTTVSWVPSSTKQANTVTTSSSSMTASSQTTNSTSPTTEGHVETTTQLSGKPQLSLMFLMGLVCFI